MFIPSCEKPFCDVESEFEILYSLLCVIDKRNASITGATRVNLTLMLILHNLYCLTVCSVSLLNRSVTTFCTNNMYVYWNMTHIKIKKYYYVHMLDIAWKPEVTLA